MQVGIGVFGDVMVNHGLEIEYITASKMSKRAFDGLVETHIKYDNGVRLISSEIFNSEESAWKEHYIDDPDHRAFIAGLELALKLLGAEDVPRRP